jgi:hypothetical protein
MAPELSIATKQIIMDKKLIQTYGEEILCYRLRSARQKKRAQYEDFHKQLIQLDKEHSALWRKKQNLGWEPLVPPVQKGWKRFFVLRGHVAKSKHATFYENILKKINTYDWSHRKDFKVKRRKFGKKIYVVKQQELLQPYDHEFARLGFTEEEKQLFQPEFFYYKSHVAPIVKYVFNEPWRFVLRTRPNIIDKVKVKDREIESRMKQIDDYMYGNAYYGTLERLLHGNRRRGIDRPDEKYNEKNPLKNKPLHEILDELKEEFL